MRAACPWCVVLVLAAGAWAQEPALPSPRPVPDKTDAEPAATPGETKSNRAAEPTDASPPPILFPLDPFPPPAPPVLDPRTGAWEQAHLGYAVPCGPITGPAEKAAAPRADAQPGASEPAPMEPPRQQSRAPKERTLLISFNPRARRWEVVEPPPQR